MIIRYSDRWGSMIGEKRLAPGLCKRSLGFRVRVQGSGGRVSPTRPPVTTL